MKNSWNIKGRKIDFYSAKGIAKAIIELAGLNNIYFKTNEQNATALDIYHQQLKLATIEEVAKNTTQQFDIKQTVFYIDIYYNNLVNAVSDTKIVYKEISKFPAVQRDLAIGSTI
jgi:phenylalanyl-tRNA synthetase beta chain